MNVKFGKRFSKDLDAIENLPEIKKHLISSYTSVTPAAVDLFSNHLPYDGDGFPGRLIG